MQAYERRSQKGGRKGDTEGEGNRQVDYTSDDSL